MCDVVDLDRKPVVDTGLFNLANAPVEGGTSATMAKMDNARIVKTVACGDRGR
jgi:hypothetical protein